MHSRKASLVAGCGVIAKGWFCYGSHRAAAFLERTGKGDKEFACAVAKDKAVFRKTIAPCTGSSCLLGTGRRIGVCRAQGLDKGETDVVRRSIRADIDAEITDILYLGAAKCGHGQLVATVLWQEWSLIVHAFFLGQKWEGNVHQRDS